MMGRALIVWLGLVVLAVANGGVRDTWIAPALGDTTGRAISTVLLSVLILGATWLLVAWVGPRTAADAWRVGALWLALTLAFEFLGGHFLFGRPWPELLADYDVRRGRIWPLVLVVTAVAPYVTARARGLVGDL